MVSQALSQFSPLALAPATERTCPPCTLSDTYEFQPTGKPITEELHPPSLSVSVAHAADPLMGAKKALPSANGS
jgi:hypothetical protein